MKMLFKIFRNTLILYIALMVIFVASMGVSYALPNTRIINNVKESLPQLEQEGTYPRLFFSSPACQLDNYTDSIMLNTSISADNSNPLKSSMESLFGVSNDPKATPIDHLSKTLSGENDRNSSYSRYWHGYLSILRPMLFLFNYMQIRYINMFILFALFGIVNYLLKKKLGTKYMVSFFATIMMTMFMIVPMSLQFSSMYYVTFISMIILLTQYHRINKYKCAVYLFFATGAVASFLDFLTAPLITLGLPLITYVLLDKDTKNVITSTGKIIINSAMWTLGYGISWASKWLIGSIILKSNILKAAMDQVSTRSSSVVAGSVISRKEVLTKNLDMIFDNNSSIFFVIAIVCFILFLISRSNLNYIINKTPLILIATYPFIWFIVLANHSDIHFWFTYRILAIAIFAILSFLVSCIDGSMLKQKFSSIFNK